jgi:NAD(P)H dehydrogenase (quinone)
MKHAVIVAHPKDRSLSCTVAQTYAEHVRRIGQEAIVRDLYRMRFDPCLRPSELPGPAGCRFHRDVMSERQALRDVDVFAFVYPLWFNAPPAILKGYVDRVFSAGFGFEPGPGGAEPLLEGKSMISFTTSGAPEEWVEDTGAMEALRTLFDRHVARMCGLHVVDHIHIGGVVHCLNEVAFTQIQANVVRVIDAQFGGRVRASAPGLRSDT